MEFESVIGLEIHAELKTQTKMFCASRNDPDEKHPNVNVCPVCLGHPGTLPVINREAVRMVQRVGVALNSALADFSKFDRKNYFYPDLPKGYQISQYDMPLCSGGYLDITVQDGKSDDSNSHLRPRFAKASPGEQGFGGQAKLKKIRITRIHLEEDTGRLLHPEGAKESLVDFNRAGVPLMELVTEPDIRSGKEARAFAEELQLILRYLGASDANMEKGQMRVEVNISLRPKSQISNSLPMADLPKGDNFQGKEDDQKLGTKVEVKNLNSLRSVEKAVEFEIERQADLLNEGKNIVQETRGWHDVKQITFSQREKESAHDYRYFPEPDLPPLRFSPETLEEIRESIPELPGARRARFVKEYSLEPKQTEVLVNNKRLGEYFEESVSELRDWIHSTFPESVAQEKDSAALKTCINWLLSDFWGMFQERGGDFAELKITPENFAEFVKMIAEGTLSSKAGKEMLEVMYETGGDPSDILEERGLSQVSDEKFIENAVEKIIGENQKAVDDYRQGKSNAVQFLVGKVMAETGGKARPELVRQLLEKKLSRP